ncbi:hypothetical protein RYX36_009112 [Vicia faba]
MDKSSIHDVILVGGSIFERKQPCKNINADGVVVHGVVVHASLLSGEFSENVGYLLLREEIPLSLGLQTHGGIMEVIIPRNTIIPTKMEHVFTTHLHNQVNILIHVYEGERLRSEENNLLEKFVLKIPPAPVGDPQIKTIFQIDDDGILHVSSTKSLGVNNKVKIISDKGRLSKEAIERMIKDAEKYKDEDKRYRKKVEARRALEKYEINMRNIIEDEVINLKLSLEDKKMINDAIDLVLMWLDVNEIAE